MRLVDGSAGELGRPARQLGVGVGQTGRRGRPRRGDQLHAHVPGLHDLRRLPRDRRSRPGFVVDDEEMARVER